MDVTQSLPPRSMNPSAGLQSSIRQQQIVQAEHSPLPSSSGVDAGPPKQALNYKRASANTKKGAKSAKKK